MTQFFSSLASSIAKDIVDFSDKVIWRQLSYMINYSKNVDNLKEEVRKLKNFGVGVQGSVDAARSNGELILPNIHEWLTSANTVVEECEKFLDEEVKANQRCFDPSCPDLKSRFRVSREAKTKTKEIEELLSNGKFDRVSYPAPPPSASSMFGADMELQESRKSTFIAIMEALRDENVNMVGVYGMGGIGKTTLVKEVAKQAEKHKQFDSIAITVVSQTPVVKKIQSEIAEGLSLKLSEENEFTRAGKLCDRLKQQKSVLIILDDLWASLDLAAIGIPPGDVYQSFKVLLTTRDQDVCNMMNVQKIFPVEVLTKSETLILFREKAGNIEDQECAINIAKECAGLPIVIVTVAASLRSKPIRVWNDALRQLRNSKPITIKGMLTDVYPKLKLSYNFLGCEEIKSFFLLCCLFPEDSDIEVEELVRYAMGLRLFEDVRDVEAAKDRAYAWVENLKACCLLLNESRERYVRMHDVIRDFAIWVASSGEHVFLVRAASRLRQWPQDDALDRYTAISLLRNDIPELPSVPYCSKLQVLLLSSEQLWELNKLPMKISATFFKSMRNLRVLTVSKVFIQVLPDSFYCLKDLRTLCLHNCKLPDLSGIESLNNLEILSLRNCSLEGLPIGMGLLTQLRLLDLSYCKFEKAIEPVILARLSRLECLNMRGVFNSQMSNNQKKAISACLAKLEHLSYLSNLVMDVPDIEDYAEDITFVNLTRFQISIGISYKTDESQIYSKALTVGPKSKKRSITLQGRIDTLLKAAEYLRMEEIEDAENALHVLESQGFSNLKHLAMSSCDKIEYLPNCSFDKLRKLSLNSLSELMYILKVQTNQLVLPNLADLSLVDLPKLKCFCHDEKHRSKNEANLDVPPETQHPLFNIKVVCPTLEHLFLSNLLNVKRIWHPQLLPAESFCNLTRLEIFNCDLTRHIIPYYLAQRLLNLKFLSVGDFDFVEELCEITEGLVVDRGALPRLKELCLSKLPRLRYFPCGFLSLKSLQILKIDNCNGLRFLFSLNEMKGLIQLKELQVSSMMMEELVTDEIGEDNKEVSQTILFHKLQTLILEDLPELACLYKGNSILDFPALKKLDIKSCPKMRILVGSTTTLFNEKVLLPSLDLLNINGCHSLSKLFSPPILPSLQNLRSLCIGDCGAIEEVLEMGEDNKEVTQTILFPKLQTLSLGPLPELACLNKGNCILDFPALMNLNIKSCPKMRTLAGSTTTLFNEKVLLPSLDRLKIYGAQISFTELWASKLSVESFCQLREIDVEGCHSLSKLFSPQILQRLQNLRELSIECCGTMEEVLEMGEDNKEVTPTILFSKLQTLILRDLQELACLYKGNCILNFPALKKLKIESCPEMRTLVGSTKTLFNEKVLLPSLDLLNINGCQSLSKLFSPPILPWLQNLRSLWIGDCGAMEEVLELGEDNKEVTQTILFPKLQTLTLGPLPELACLNKGNCILDFPALMSLNIKSCPKMRTLVGSTTTLFNEKVLLPSLDFLVIFGAQIIFTELWANKFSVESFCQLREMTMRSCHSLSKLFSPQILPQLRNLRELTVSDCDAMEEVLEQGGHIGDKHTFPQLHKLTILSLPNLRSFSSGNGTLVWPALREIEVCQCPNMQNFSQESVIAPNLTKITDGAGGQHFEGDLNSDIRRMLEYQKTDVYIDARERYERSLRLELSDDDEEW